MQNRADPRLLDAERLIQERLGDRPLDFDSLLAVSNIYRAATAVRRRAERVLEEGRLPDPPTGRRSYPWPLV